MDPDCFLNLHSPADPLDHLQPWSPPELPDLSLICSTQPPPLPLLDTYSSVLTLSDIASALPAFSRPASQLPLTAAASSSFDAIATPGSTPQLPSHAGALSASAINKTTKRDLVVDEIEDVKPIVDSSPSLDMRAFGPKRWCFGDKRPKLAPGDPECENTVDSHEHRLRKPINKEGLSPREAHIHSERQRRRSMTDSFATLQSLIPRLNLKHTDRITVLTEVITYIQSLRGTLEELERKRSDIMALLGFPEDCPSKHRAKRRNSLIDHIRGARDFDDDGTATVDVTVRLSGIDVFVTVNTPKQRGVWSRVLMLLQRYSVEVVNATMATSGESNFHCIHGKVRNTSKMETIDLRDKLEKLIVEDLRRKANQL